MNGNNVIYFGSFRDEHLLKEIKKFMGNENMTQNFYRIQEYNLIMCGYFCIRFIDFMLKVKICWLVQIYNLFENMKRMLK